MVDDRPGVSTREERAKEKEAKAAADKERIAAAAAAAKRELQAKLGNGKGAAAAQQQREQQREQQQAVAREQRTLEDFEKARATTLPAKVWFRPWNTPSRIPCSGQGHVEVT